MHKTSPHLAIVGISGYGRIHLELVRECAERGLARLVAAVVINPHEEQVAVAELRQLDESLRAGFATGCTLQAAGFGRATTPRLR